MRVHPFVAFAVLLGACAPSTQLSENHAAAIQDSVRRMLADYEAVAERLDLDAMIAFYDTAATFHWIEQGRVAYPSHDSLETVLRSFGGSLASVTMSMSDVRIVPLTPGAALVSAWFEETLTFRDTTMSPLPISGAFTAVLRNTSDGWRFAAGHASSPLPNPGR